MMVSKVQYRSLFSRKCLVLSPYDNKSWLGHYRYFSHWL